MIKKIVINIMVFLVLLVSLEFATRYVVSHKKKGETKSLNYYNAEDPILGYSAVPGVVADVELKVDGEILYSVQYSFDEYGRRKTPIETSSRPFFALFFGGSNTFGEGVGQKQTLAYHFSQMNKDYESYNYAFRGYGPNQLLAQLETKKIKQEISQDKGVAFYQYFSYHRGRLLGTAHYFSWSRGNAPSYVFQDGELTNVGMFRRGRFFYYWALRGLSYLNLLGVTKTQYPKDDSDYTYRLMCEALKKSKKLFLQQFPKSRFVVVLGLDEPMEDKVDICLKENQISFIDLRQAWRRELGSHSIKEGVDGHLNARAYQFIGEQLSLWLREAQKESSVEE